MRPTRSALAGLLFASATGSLAAQTLPAGQHVAVVAPLGGCAASVTVTAASEPRVVWVQVNKFDSGRHVVEASETGVVVPLRETIPSGARIRATVDGGETWSVEVPPVGTASRADKKGCPKESAEIDTSDVREAADAEAFVGGAIDTFAPSKIANYGPDDETRIRVRAMAGGSLNYRIAGSAGRNLQLWMFTEAMYGARTTDFCPSVDPADCLKKTQGNFTDGLRRTIISATSMEVFIQPRLELFALQKDTNFATKVYVTGRFGAIGVLGAQGFESSHHAGGGVIATNGAFEGSFFEIGWGRSDIFASANKDKKPHWNRLKYDGLLTFPVAPSMYGFLEIFVDVNPNLGESAPADGMQTFMGFEIDMHRFAQLLNAGK